MPQAVVDLRNPLPALRARLALAGGNLAEAARWVRDRGLAVDDEPVYPREPEYRVLARVLLAEHDPAPALELLERWRALARRPGSGRRACCGCGCWRRWPTRPPATSPPR